MDNEHEKSENPSCCTVSAGDDTINVERDIVCGMTVEPETSEYYVDHGDEKFYFCSGKCLKKFTASPDIYLNPIEESIVKNDAIYTCPMHPEIEQIGPGSCPICGMALEAKDIMSGEEDTTELDDMTRRFWVCAVLSLPILLLVMLDHLPGKPLNGYISSVNAMWIEFALASPVMLWGALPFFQKGWRSVISRNLNMFTLIAIGTGVAYLYSIVASIAPHIFPSEMRMDNGLVDVYFEAAAVIVTLVLLGQVMELRARSQTTSAIKALLDLSPKTARIVGDDGERDIPLDMVQVGDTLRVRPGEAVPVDGVVIKGNSLIDEAMITGESVPVLKDENDKVTGGTINQTGSFLMIAEHVGSETVLSKIVHMVSEAQRSRAPIQKMADIVAGYFVPIVLLVAASTAIVWGIWGPEPRIAYAVINAVAVLIIACPCALGLATPMSIMVGTGRGAQAGVLIKNAESLELLEKVDVLVIDKTGTLTEGHPQLTSVISNNDYSDDDVLFFAASLEQGSEHPLAKAIIDAGVDQGHELDKVVDFKSYTGKGVSGLVNDTLVALGNDKLLEEFNIEKPSFANEADILRSKGETVMFVAVEGELIGLIGVSDPIKETTPQALKLLRQSGLRIVMLTGDNEKTAKAVAGQLDIDEIEAGVLPDQKKDYVERQQNKGLRVAMAGDGVNDAPALAQADVGIAMGTGADIAMESSEVTLVRGDLTGIVRARKLSRATMRNIRQNLFFAFAYNVTGVPIAAGLFYPIWGVLLSPIVASVAMTFSSVSVIVNALRLKREKL